MHAIEMGLTREPARRELGRGGVDSILGRLTREPLHELRDPVREPHSRREPEQLGRARRVRIAVPDVPRAVASRPLRL